MSPEDYADFKAAMLGAIAIIAADRECIAQLEAALREIKAVAPATDEPRHGVEHPADGTWSPAIGNASQASLISRCASPSDNPQTAEDWYECDLLLGHDGDHETRSMCWPTRPEDTAVDGQ